MDIYCIKTYKCIVRTGHMCHQIETPWVEAILMSWVGCIPQGNGWNWFNTKHIPDKDHLQVKLNLHCKAPGGRLNKKDGLTRYGDSHVKDKTS